ncbi:MAG: 3-dehydroquinate synthase [Candidatus Melainabacteria bacterium]|nr:3-dehydroquinate synthase [Candidatus Melainabacteria bacterium]
MAHKARHRGPVITMLWNTNLEVKTRVAIGIGARQKLSNILAQIGSGKRVLVLCQPSTAVHWLRDLLSVLPQEDYQVTTLEVPDGEACKTTDWLIRIWEHLQERKFDRRDTIVALGGGSVTDLAGFAASTYLRGLNLVLVPTSLLGMVDAAIGGKTGINLQAGKNLAGTFFFPKAVLADQELLSTLPENQFKSGIGEIIKYGMIEDTVAKTTDYELGPKRMLDVLDASLGHTLAHDDPGLSGIISSCIKMKLFVVAKDPQEANLRRILNLGHTIGHAIETLSDYKVSHGEAVGIGLFLDTKYSVKQKRIDKAALDKVEELLAKAGLSTSIPSGISKEKVVTAMGSDKKRDGQTIKLVLPQTKLGVVDYDVTVPLSDLSKTL